MIQSTEEKLCDDIIWMFEGKETKIALDVLISAFFKVYFYCGKENKEDLLETIGDLYDDYEKISQLYGFNKQDQNLI